MKYSYKTLTMVWLLSHIGLRQIFILLFLLGSCLIFGQKHFGLTALSSDNQQPTGIFNGNTTNGIWQDETNLNNAWLRVDLGSLKEIGAIKIYWENANAKDYILSFSIDGENYFGLQHYNNMASGNRVDVVKELNTSCRYILMQGVTRQMNYGYGIFEFEVYAPFISSLTSIDISPKNTILNFGVNQQFVALGKDQINEIIPLSNPVVWNVNESGGQINSTGNFTASTSGLFTISATVNEISSSVSTEVMPSNPNVAIGKTAFASSGNGGAAFDNNQGSRWESKANDVEWIMVDLTSIYNCTDLRLSWETANAKAYNIEASTDSIIWETIVAKSEMGTGARVDRLYGLSFEARYIRLNGAARNTVWGYSIWEFGVHGTPKNTQNPGADTDPPSPPFNLTANPAVYAVFLTWQPSTDNVGVTQYRIFKNGAFEALLDGNSTSMTISGLNPNTTYTFSVRTYDAAGNASDETSVETITQERYIDDTTARYGIGNIAVSMPTNHSSATGNSANGSSNAVDGNSGSRWESLPNDAEWMSIDLGLKYYIGSVVINWEVASGQHYVIEVSDNQEDWITAVEFHSTEALPHQNRSDELSFEPITGRFIRMRGIKRNTPWGFSIFEFEVYSPGSGADDIPNPNPNPNPPPVPPGPSTFSLIAPAPNAMITNTRRPTLSWNAVTDASSYEVWVNITRDDYDWYAWGSLLDRFTKVGEVTGNSFNITDDLPDRWTYKWYIVAKKGNALEYSDLGVFSVYLPTVTNINDGISIINGCRDLNKNGTIDDYENWRLPVHTRVANLMSLMTMEEKVYQMFYNAQSYPQAGWAFGPGTVSHMFEIQKASAQTRLGIPYVSAGDNIHGYKTTFPVQSALAASRNLDLTYKCANMQRVEQIAVGARGVLGPLAEVGTKVLYPRIQEGCGEDAEFAAAMVRAMICGLQGGPELNPNSVMVTTKHWPGQGAGGEAVVVYDAITAKYHLKPWFGHMDAGGATVMPGYAGSTYLDPGGPGAGDSKKIIDYLRNTVGFDGPVCTDWLPSGAWINAANAGSDIMGGADPGAAGFTLENFIASVPEARINEAVSRILTVKFKLGVFEDPYGDPVNGDQYWHTNEFQNIAIDAARQSMTLLKNNGILPLTMAHNDNLLVTGSRAHDGDGYRIWTSYFHRELGAKTMYESILERGKQNGFNVFRDDANNPQAAVLIIGEPTYTHGTMWHNEKPWIHDAYYAIGNRNEFDLTTLKEVKALGIPIVVVITMPRPYILTDIMEMADAVLIAYRTGDGAGPALTQILFGDYAPTGRLPWQLPRSMEQIGTDNLSNQAERWDLPFDLGATATDRQEIRSKIANNEPLYPIYGNPLFQYGYGIQGYLSGEDDTLPVSVNLVIEAKSSTNHGILLYPNPASNKLTMALENQDSYIKSITIYNVSGIRVGPDIEVSGQKIVTLDVDRKSVV